MHEVSFRARKEINMCELRDASSSNVPPGGRGVYAPHAPRRPDTGRLRRALMTVLVGLVAGAASAPALAEKEAAPAAACRLRAADLVALAKRFAKFHDDLPDAAKLGLQKIIAYEENKHFVYVRGTGAAGDRRVIFCKPATFIIDDRPAAAASAWRLDCSTRRPKITKRGFSVAEGDAVITGQVLLPDAGAVSAGAVALGASYGVETSGSGKAADARFVHVLHVGGKDAAAPKTEATKKDGVLKLKLTAGDPLGTSLTFTLALGGKADESGTIAIAQGSKAVLGERFLPGGIMPHGDKGVRMMDGWDRTYRGGRRPGWDVGRPASVLEAAIKDGAVKSGRALELGCGTGTNAVYLAQKGFDVTAIDVAPTCLTIARDKAGKAKVKVRWVVADVLNLPALGQFDFIFDRGCYHGVRRVSADGFVKSVNAVSKPGTLMLIIAGNANEPRHYGPPRVDETEMVNDFGKTWDFVWLKETRLDSRNPKAKSSAWSWSILLRRRAPKK